MDKMQREARRRQEDQALNRGLLWVGGAILLEMLMLLVKRVYVEFRINTEEYARMLMVDSALKVIRISGIAVAAACLVWAFLRLKSKKSATLPVVLFLISGALAMTAHVTVAFFDVGVQMLFLLIPAWAGLALVYYLYQREFFLSAAASGMSVLGLWFVRSRGGFCPEALLMLLGIAVVLIAAVLAKQGNGTVSLAGIRIPLLPGSSTSRLYTLIQVTCAVSLVALLASMALGGTLAYYLIFAMIAWMFGLLVYFTVKLM